MTLDSLPRSSGLGGVHGPSIDVQIQKNEFGKSYKSTPKMEGLELYHASNGLIWSKKILLHENS